MWDSAFLVSAQQVTYALLRKSVLPKGGNAFEKVSAAIAVRFALCAKQSQKKSLLIVVPEATANTARQVLSALLIGNHAHSKGGDQLPAEEVRQILKRDILFVTHAVSDCKRELDELYVGGHERIKDLWEILPLSKYTKSKSDKPRVFLANPGWMKASVEGRRFSAVIIDASHPRTHGKLHELLKTASGCADLRFAVAPPMEERALRTCGWPNQTSVWIWDPQAIKDAQIVVECNDDQPRNVGERHLWICDDDAEAAKALAQLRNQLASVAKASADKSYPGLRLCWSIYNRLRQLTVPLAQLEQAASNTWSGSLRERIDALQDVNGHGNPIWDSSWPELVEAVKAAYQVLLTRQKTAKFWAVAKNVEAFLASPAPHLRVVASSDIESDLLFQALARSVNGVREAVAAGRLEIITGTQELRLVAEGQRSPTVLLGPRANGSRHLDVFTSMRVDVLLYPHELEVEHAIQARLHDLWAQECADERRLQFLAPLGFKPSSRATPKPASCSPRLHVRRTDGHPVELALPAQISNVIDIDALVWSNGTTQGDEKGWPTNDERMLSQSGDFIEIKYVGGTIERYYSRQKVDVFFTETDTVQRHPVTMVQPGWKIILFVDASYDSLYDRLAEVVSSRLNMKERVALELWRSTKAKLVRQYESKSDLYQHLRTKGLKSTCAVFMHWFDTEGEVLAPQQFAEFEIVARESEVYRNGNDMLNSTFEAVQHERGRRRTIGKALRRFLRAAASGSDYEEALTSALSLDAALGDVLAAVEVRTVQSVHANQRSS